MAEGIALWGRDIDESSADVSNAPIDNGHHDPITEPIPVAGGGNDAYGVEEAPDHEPTGYEDEAEPKENGRPFSYVRPFIDRRPGSPGDLLTFKPPPTPWFRTGRGLVVLVTIIGVGVVALIVLMLRSPATEEPTNVTPTTQPAPSSAPPVFNSVAPSLTGQPAPPPPPPPGPPPPPVQDVPAYQPQYPSSGGRSPSESKPEFGVTRAPISASPEPVTPPTSAKVGD